MIRSEIKFDNQKFRKIFNFKSEKIIRRYFRDVFLEISVEQCVSKRAFREILAMNSFVSNQLYHVFSPDGNMKKSQFVDGFTTICCGSQEENAKLVYDFLDLTNFSSQDDSLKILLFHFFEKSESNHYEHLEKIEKFLSTINEENTRSFENFSSFLQKISSDLFFSVFINLLKRLPIPDETLENYSRFNKEFSPETKHSEPNTEINLIHPSKVIADFVGIKLYDDIFSTTADLADEELDPVLNGQDDFKHSYLPERIQFKNSFLLPRRKDKANTAVITLVRKLGSPQVFLFLIVRKLDPECYHVTNKFTRAKSFHANRSRTSHRCNLEILQAARSYRDEVRVLR